MLISKMFRKPTGIFSNHHCTKGAGFTSLFILAVCLVLFCFTTSVTAEVTWSGDVDPDDPTAWTWSGGFVGTQGYIGKTGLGTLNITNGGTIIDLLGNIGYEYGSTGVVTVNGISSTWTNMALNVGYEGMGVLNITDGGAVSNNYSIIGNRSGGIGQSTVDGLGSTWTSVSSIEIGKEGIGVLNITNGGTVSSEDCYIGNVSTAMGQVMVDGLGSTLTNDDLLLVGFQGIGQLSITNGGAVSNGGSGVIGETSTSMGRVTVDGPDSTWANGGLVIGLRGTGQLSITNGGAVSNVDGGVIGHIPNSIGLVTVDGPGSIWANDSRLYVGIEGNATLNITNGGVVIATHIVIGRDAGSIGQVTVDGANSILTNNSVLYVGKYGSGTLNITGGASVTVLEDSWVGYENSSSTINFDNGTLTTKGFGGGVNSLNGTGIINTNGLVSDVELIFDASHGLTQTFTLNEKHGQDITINLNVDGSGSMGAGYGGMGTMSISDGRVIESFGGYIGCNSGSKGVVTVDGPSSVWANSDDLYVGRYGNGTLNITGGGAVSNDGDCYIGKEFGSRGVISVDGVGSTWASNGTYLYIGRYGSGALNITGGGSVNSNYIYIGKNSGSTGEITVDGIGSTCTNSGGLSVGDWGSGTLNITSGGAVSNSWSRIAGQFDSTGMVTVDGPGSIWTNISDLRVGTLGNGTLNITNGGEVSNLDGYIGNYSSSTGVVTVDGAGSTWTNSADLYIGRWGNGVLNVTNAGLVSVAGTLIIDEFDGDGFINMATGGMLTLYDEADASASLAEFLGLIDGTDAIRYWDYALGDWTDIAGATLGEDFVLDYITTPGDELLGYTMLTVLEQALLIGDANRDGVISASDYAAVQANFGNTGLPGIHGDANGDGVVSASDYASVQTNYGNVAAGGETSITPEPATLSLLALGGVMVTIRRKRK